MQRLQLMNTILALIVLVLLGVIAWQQMRISGLTADLQQSQRSLEAGVERLAMDRIKSLQRADMVSTVQWLDDFYRSPEGLQRPDGLWRADVKKADGEAIGVWVLDVSPRWGSVLMALARPKSSTLTTPPGVTLIFAGFRSRWTTSFS